MTIESCFTGERDERVRTSVYGHGHGHVYGSEYSDVLDSGQRRPEQMTTQSTRPRSPDSTTGAILGEEGA
jgi:hypothetical protein